MSDLCGRFYFALDMNGDAATTVSDIGMLLEMIWRIPSNAIVYALQGWPVTENFFEIDCYTGQGIGGAVFSSIVWIVLIGAIASEFNDD